MMEKANKLLGWFLVLLAIAIVSFYTGEYISSIGLISRGIFLISVIAAPVVFICFLAEKIGKKMPTEPRHKMLISKPFQWIIGILLLFIYFWLFVVLIH